MSSAHWSVLLAPILLISFAIARGAELPKYDSNLYCKTSTAMFGSNQDIFVKSCLELEEKRRHQISSKLDRFSSDTFATCDSTARMMAGGSYQVFAGCLAMDVADRFLNGKLDIVPVSK
jgi:hypothetical protein